VTVNLATPAMDIALASRRIGGSDLTVCGWAGNDLVVFFV
jgi:hypothetical protein